MATTAGFPTAGRSYGAIMMTAYSPLSTVYEAFYATGPVAPTDSSIPTPVNCPPTGGADCWYPRRAVLGAPTLTNTGVGLLCATCEVGVASRPMQVVTYYGIVLSRPATTPPPVTFNWFTQVVPHLPPQV